jgi:D-alanyl-D-alanine carboxypeptidase (penicillin-binding protein 5/6)
MTGSFLKLGSARKTAGLLTTLWLACLLSAHADTITTEASHVAILDAETGVLLFEKNGLDPMVPASMSKLMTAYVVFQRIKEGRLALTDTFTVSEDAWRRGGWTSGGSTMSLKPNEQPTVQDLLRGMIIHSGNDACIVLAEGISGSEAAFADEMTRVAQSLGLKTAKFKNATGLFDPEHKMSAADLAELSRRIIVDFPEHYGLYSEQTFTWDGITQPNRNPLLGKIAGVDGLKTGHLSQSGYGLAASGVRDGVRRIVVFNGMPTESARAREAERLMRLAFSEFEVANLYKTEAIAGRLPVFLGKADDVAVGVEKPIVVGLQKGSGERLQARAQLAAPLKAPVTVGQVIGTLEVVDGSRVVASAPLVAKEAVPMLGLMGRAIRGLQLTLGADSSDSAESAEPSR